jgi:Flp pilus assembly protein TadB
MTSGVSLVGAWAGAASASKSFSITAAVVIFVVVIVLVTLGVALVGRRTRLLVTRPRLRTAHSRRIRRAALEDVREIEQEALRDGRGRPGREVPSREEENDDL